MTEVPVQIPAPQADPAKEPPGRFAGRVAVVTGASDKGIGGAIAERLAREGAAVMTFSRHTPRKLNRIFEKLQLPAMHVDGDVTKKEDVQNAIQACVARFGRIDILINNAGMEIAEYIDRFTDEAWEQLLNVNLNGSINMIRGCLPHMPDPSVIVNVASALALGGCSGFSIYSASKAGLIGLTQSLAWELAPRGIRVVAVAPGLVHTPMIHKHMDKLTPAVMQQIRDSHPLGMGTPHDVASAVTFLASSDAKWITGVTLPLGWASHYPLPTQALMG